MSVRKGATFIFLTDLYLIGLCCRMEPILRSMLEMAVLYEDLKTYGPFGARGYEVNSADKVESIPTDGTIHAVIAQFSATGNVLCALQFVHRVTTKLHPCKVHSTTAPNAGETFVFVSPPPPSLTRVLVS